MHSGTGKVAFRVLDALSLLLGDPAWDGGKSAMAGRRACGTDEVPAVRGSANRTSLSWLWHRRVSPGVVML